MEKFSLSRPVGDPIDTPGNFGAFGIVEKAPYIGYAQLHHSTEVHLAGPSHVQGRRCTNMGRLDVRTRRKTNGEKKVEVRPAVALD